MTGTGPEGSAVPDLHALSVHDLIEHVVGSGFTGGGNVYSDPDIILYDLMANRSDEPESAGGAWEHYQAGLAEVARRAANHFGGQEGLGDKLPQLPMAHQANVKPSGSESSTTNGLLARQVLAPLLVRNSAFGVTAEALLGDLLNPQGELAQRAAEYPSRMEVMREFLSRIAGNFGMELLPQETPSGQ